jgi:hypothetical protein
MAPPSAKPGGNVVAKFVCRCGHIIDLVRSPAPEEWILVPEADLDDVVAAANRKEQDADQLYAIIDRRGVDVVVCPVCDRLWVEQIGDRGVFRAYRPEGEPGKKS